MKQRIVVLTGAGISAESGLQTFRDGDGLWEGHDVTQVATPQAWERDAVMVQRFYNDRRKAVLEAQPNAAHAGLVELEKGYEVNIITQNIDDLHERAGSSSVMHLHGQVLKAQSSVDPTLVYDIDGWELPMGHKCEKGSQLRPHVVWFGEPVPMMIEAVQLVKKADIFVVVGTSLVVYPAASLVDFVPAHAPKYIVDPKVPMGGGASSDVTFITKRASEGVPELVRELTR
ncbi:NAD-dependent deacylase [Oligoflexia bacterium]|nr:NAD-dependent deacylase [Oligoflexia bacterium]